MENRAHNFFAGPAALPLEVLKQAQAELLNFRGTGVSVMEIIHRDKAFIAVTEEAEADLKKLLGLGDDYAVLFLGGGATHQFIMLPMNVLNEGDCADYVDSGNWAHRAYIGFLSIAYNIRCDKDVLPSLSSKIASATGLKLDYPPQEMAYLGCAAGLFSLESSVKYCREYNKAAITFLFDQCSWIANPTYDVDSPDFKENLKTTLLFADGAAGILVIPESMRYRFDLPLMEVDEIITDFVSGGSLSMHEGKLILEDNLKDTVPDIVHEKIIKPLGVTPQNIDEWSLHQGGMPILMRFMEPEILGLNEEQISRSKSIFEKYGNFSSPSVMFVLETWFKDENRSEKDEKIRGCAISFGAGYFMGGMTYHWSKK